MNLDTLIKALQILRHSPTQKVEMHTPGKFDRLRFKPIGSIWVSASGVVYLSTEESVQSAIKADPK